MSDSKIRFACPHCGAKLRTSLGRAGRQLKCAKCGQSLTVPRPPEHKKVILIAAGIGMGLLVLVAGALWLMGLWTGHTTEGDLAGMPAETRGPAKPAGPSRGRPGESTTPAPTSHGPDKPGPTVTEPTGPSTPIAPTTPAAGALPTTAPADGDMEPWQTSYDLFVTEYKAVLNDKDRTPEQVFVGKKVRWPLALKRVKRYGNKSTLEFEGVDRPLAGKMSGPWAQFHPSPMGVRVWRQVKAGQRVVVAGLIRNATTAEARDPVTRKTAPRGIASVVDVRPLSLDTLTAMTDPGNVRPDGTTAEGQDWPQFRGPRRDGICRETGLLAAWPEGGPSLVATISGVGRGLSGVSIVGHTLYTMGDLDTDGGRNQWLIAIDLNSRQLTWRTKVGKPHRDGPRCTPTVDGGQVFAIGTEGDLVCCDAQKGTLQWKKNFALDFGGKMMSQWKYSESPLVDGRRVICTPGGKGAVMVALRRSDGRDVWKCDVPGRAYRGKEGAGYASMIVTDYGGLRQYIQLIGRGLIGVRASDGKFMWGYDKIANTTANCASPVTRDAWIFASTAYQTGSALLRITRTRSEARTQQVYFLRSDTFQNHHGGFVLVGDYLYGGHGLSRGRPTCLELKTGKILWQVAQPGKGSAAVLYADGHLIFRYEDGLVCLIEANPKEYKLTGSFTPPKVSSGPAWVYPAISRGILYLRHDDVIHCYDLRQKR